MGKISSISKLKSSDTTFIAGFHNILTYIKVFMIKNWDHTSVADFLQYS